MMIKFLARGTGSAAAAADYLTREQNLAPDQDQDQDQDRDPEKNPEEVKVLRGHPHQVATVADTLQFEHKYTSGVIAWAPEDKPSDAQIGRVVDEFEKTAWAGLEPDRYTWAAVQHREAGGGVHVHVLAARVDLETGKSLNIAAPGWQKTFDALRDWQNHENGWSRPDDPERARDVQPGHRAYIEAAQLRAGLTAEKDPRRLITDYLSQGIETGAVSDRATMVSALQRAGLEVVRQGEHYLTAVDPESGGKWRLKGAIYERDFQRERLTSPTPEEGRAGPGTNRGIDSDRAEEARRKLEAERGRRGVYHRARYQGSHPSDERGAVGGVAAERGDRSVSLSRHLGRELRPDAMVCQPDPEPHRDAVGTRIRDPRGAPDHRADRANHVGRETRRGQRPALRDPAGEHPRKSALEHGRTTYRQAIERVKELYDRVRTAVDERLNRAVEAVRSGDGAAGRVGRRIAGAGAAARRIGQGLEAAAREDRSAGRGFEAASQALEEGLQGDRRSIARGVNAIWKQQQQSRERQRGPERDFGPSR